MREIKFRVWHKERKRMLKVNALDFVNHGGLVTPDWQGNQEYLSKVELMQYTGLKDRNGKEVWEGDVLQVGRSVGVVQYEGDGFVIIWSSNPEGWNSVLMRHNDNAEVVSNIYEGDNHAAGA